MLQKAPSTCQALSGSHSPANGWLPIGREQVAPYGANTWCIIAREMTIVIPTYDEIPVSDCEVVGGAVSEALFRDGLCLPSGTAMSQDDLARVAAVVRKTGHR